MDFFEQLAVTLIPIVNQSGHRIRTPDEMYVSVGDEELINRIAALRPIESTMSKTQTVHRKNMWDTLPPSSQRPQNARITNEVVRKAGRISTESAEGYTRLELRLVSPNIMTDYNATRRWARENGLHDVPVVSSLGMNLIAPTEDPFPKPTLDHAVTLLRRIAQADMVIQLVPVVPYGDFFVANGFLLPTQQQRV